MGSIEKAIGRLTGSDRKPSRRALLRARRQKAETAIERLEHREAPIDIDVGTQPPNSVTSVQSDTGVTLLDQTAPIGAAAIPERSQLTQAANERIVELPTPDAGQPQPSQINDTYAAVEPIVASTAAVPDHRHGGVAGQVPEGRAVRLPIEKLAGIGMVTPSDPKSKIAEEYRAIKRQVLTNIDRLAEMGMPNANIVMVTSCVEGEGKTFSSINLATSIAMEMDKSVLFVDTDVAKASAGALLGLPDDSYGLIDLLQEPSPNLADAIWHTDIPNLKLMPAGQIHDHAYELIGSHAMRALAQELSTRYADRVVIFDAPPMLMTSEAVALTEHAGQVLFVVAAESTTQHSVHDALSQIPADREIGLVLNKARKASGRSYGYGYAYGGYNSRPGAAHREKPDAL